jgi:predicted dehydrogenase
VPDPSSPDGPLVGLVGAGTIAETHLAVLGAIPGARLAFVVDPDPGKHAVLAGVEPPRYDRLGEALAAHRPELDLIVIATPTPTHAELATEALTGSDARVLVEKPVVADLAALDRLRALDPALGVRERLFVAHHFAFSPEVVWAAGQIAAHPEWGPVTDITTVFHDPYLVDAAHSFAAYGSAWVDSGVNQLSMLSRFVELSDRGPVHESAGGATCWCTATFRSGTAGDTTGAALLRASWEAIASSKGTTLRLAGTGTEIWLDHTAVTALVTRAGAVEAALVNDGRTPRKVAHYRPLYASLLSDAPDSLLGFALAERVTELLYR